MATSQFSEPSNSPSSRHQQLASEHAALEQQLQSLRQKPHLSSEDEIEATRLKKLKLHVKDAMHSMQT